MKRNFSSKWRGAIAMVMALTLTLVMAVPVSAASVTSSDFDINVSADDAVDVANTGAAIGDVTMDIVIGDADGSTSIVLVIQSADYQWVDVGTADDGTADGEGFDTVAGVISQTTNPNDTLTFDDEVGSNSAVETVTIAGATIAATVGAGIASVTDVFLSYDGAVTPITDEDIGDVTEVPGVANKYVIIDPTNGTVDAAITVTVELQDQSGNLVTTGGFKDTDVQLDADGSATGDGVDVSINNGTGTLDISDQVAETVNLGLFDSQSTSLDVSSTQNVIFAHGAATKYVITDPTNGTVDAAITVTIELQDQYGNLVTTGGFKDTDVQLDADGSATGDGVDVSINNGTGTLNISDEVAETVNLSLTDSQTTSLNVSSTQDVIFAAGAVVTPDGRGSADGCCGRGSDFGGGAG